MVRLGSAAADALNARFLDLPGAQYWESIRVENGSSRLEMNSWAGQNAKLRARKKIKKGRKLVCDAST